MDIKANRVNRVLSEDKNNHHSSYMMEEYLLKALKEDITDTQFMNVIRIILGKNITHTGADGENHYKTIAKKKQMENLNNLSEEEIESEINEDQEIEEIAGLFNPDI